MNEEQILKSKLIVYGYEIGREPIKLTNELIGIGQYLIRSSEVQKASTISLYKASKSDIVKATKSFFDKNFDLHKVPFFEESKAQQIINEYNLGNYNLEEVLQKTKEEASMMDPFNLPLEHIEGMLGGKVRKPIFLIPNEEYLKKAPINFSQIILGDNLSKLSIPSYGHEIVHTQLDSIKGSMRNYHNKEFLSIFIEKVIALSLDNKNFILGKTQLIRFKNLLHQIQLLNNSEKFSKIDLVESSSYIVSALKAQNLFDKYMNGNSKLKKEILDDIQKTFDGILTVEQILKKYNITLENSSNIQLIKKHL